ncbi:MAG: TonB-dependent receptor [Ferruginibacter sp.]
MKQKLLLLFVCYFFTIAATFAKDVNIHGKITDKNGVAIAGATITLKGSGAGTSTDANGEYTFKVPEGRVTLVISSVGYKKFEITITATEEGIFNFTLDTLTDDLTTVVVTGSSNPRKKIESSVAITTFNADRIQQLAPMSTADMLQAIPGFVAETSGGEVGNNLFARGIPSAGAYEYVQVQEDGLPIFEDGALQFANIDNFHRVDLTVKSAEAVRGGTAAIYASGAPGGIINFISNTGQNQTKGTVKLTTGTYGLFKTEFNLGGALSEDRLFYNIGGFYRTDNGVRNPGFKANNGGQLKLNLTYKFDNGYIRGFYKKLNDRNIFYQVTPFIKDGDKVKGYPGFDPNYGTFASPEMANIRVPQYGGGYFTADLKDGVHPVSDAAGTDFYYKLSPVASVKNTFKYTTINQDYNAIFAPSWMGAIMSQAEYATSAGIDPANAQFNYVTGDAGLLASDVKLKRADLWFINKKMANFANNLSFNFKLKNVDLDLGYYHSDWKSKHYWNWNSFLVTASDHPRLVNLLDRSNGISRTYNGISQITWLERAAEIQGNVNAFFANADIKASKRVNLNIGLRYDADRYNGNRDNASFGAHDLGILDNNTADDAVTSIQGNPYTYWKYKIDHLSYTGAVNVKLNEKMAVYLRQSHGFRAPIEESFYDNAASVDKLKITTIDQTELGFKGALSKNVTLYASAFYMQLSNIAYQDIVAGGVSEGKFADVKNLGLEVEMISRFNRLGLTLNATIQDPKYSSFKGSNGSGTFDYNDNVARRIPKTYFILRPDFDISNQLNVYVKWAYFGKKFQDEANTFELPAFNTFDAGITYKLKNVSFTVNGSNIFNAIGLTEGDGSAPQNGAVFMARSILGASARASVTINF